ncbi:MAG: transmembrane Mn(2+) transporter [Planctomyces sp.]|nr:transmembrane Mn(2+) transporter [Planctomyces sp.]
MTETPGTTPTPQDPPRTFSGTLRQLGPGLIIAGSIVGSGELILTTKTGAQAGMTLLWLIILGCIIKVFVQIELGRYSITRGVTTLAALNSVPGPRLRVNWILWFWVAMMLASTAQLGGIVGGVGQSLAIAFPVTGDYATYVAVPAHSELKRYIRWTDDFAAGEREFAQLTPEEQRETRRGVQRIAAQLERLPDRGAAALEAARLQEKAPAPPFTWDDRMWAGLPAIVTTLMLFFGRYGMVQNLATMLVAAFTFATIGNVLALQQTADWRITGADLAEGFAFRLPSGRGGLTPLATALATFGIIGVGATELIAYPYWCIEKGYARFTGPRSDDASWAVRAKGWMRVMHWDAALSMVVYTLATLAFYIMGAAVLHREGLDPAGMRMVSTLTEAYVPVFGEHARWLFLGGAFAVLYSTYLVAIAGHALTYSDGLRVFGLIPKDDPASYRWWVTAFRVTLPLLCLAIFWTGYDPVSLILISGAMQATMLPMIGFAALYLRWTSTDPRLRPRRIWDVMLVISCLGLFVAGTWGVYEQFEKVRASFSAKASGL